MNRPPAVNCELHHPTLSVADLSASIGFYTTKLGFSLDFTWGDPPTTAGLDLDKVSIHLREENPAPRGCGSIYFVVGNADELYDFQRANGVSILQPLQNQPWGFRDYRVRDHDGTELTFGHRLPVSKPPIKIERVEVPVRLEKRLASLLQDLANHKSMSVSACLEETLLHSFEPIGEGSACPHTKRTLAHVQELKAKHGLDYDAHDSYRFVE